MYARTTIPCKPTCGHTTGYIAVRLDLYLKGTGFKTLQCYQFLQSSFYGAPLLSPAQYLLVPENRP
jgi:hypothetical protein